MRITQQTMYARAMAGINRSRSREATLNQQITSGERLEKVGDDPSATPTSLRQQSALRQIETHEGTLNSANHMLANTDSVLGQVTNLTQRLQEIATKYASDTYNATDRAKGADEVDQIREQLVDLANTKTADGRYLFGGLGNAGAPYDDAGVFSGDTGKLTVSVGSSKIDATVAGGQPFEDAGGGGGASLFSTIDALEASLRHADPTVTEQGPDISRHLTQLKTHVDRIATTREDVGFTMNRVDNMKDGLASAKLSSTEVLSDVQSTDMLSAASELTQVQTALQAAMLTTSKINSLNLMQFM